MKRTHAFLPEPMIAQLRKIADHTGVSVSELIRRAVDEYLQKKG